MVVLEDLVETVEEAVGGKTPLNIIGGKTKAAFANPVAPSSDDIDVTGFRGVIDYAPSEMMLRARAGTSIEEINALLASEGQMLGFEPASFGGASTLGGTVATSWAGARRPWGGNVRDAVLGVGLISVAGGYNEFGGQVMKNVAGFDVARLICGSWGALGVIADVSLRTLPVPEREMTLVQPMNRDDALSAMLGWSNKGLPVSGQAWHDGCLYVRLAGTDKGVDAASSQVGGDATTDGPWQSLAECTLFIDAEQIWRLSVAPASRQPLAEAAALDWGGARRWLVDPPFDPRSRYPDVQSYLVRDRSGRGINRSPPLSSYLARLHRNLKQHFDPPGLFNPGRLYDDL